MPADQIVSLKGYENAYLSLQESLEYWKTFNQVTTGHTQQHFDAQADDTSVIATMYGSKEMVCEVIIENGGHTWPNADPFNIGLPLGSTTQDFDFNSFFWQYLIK